MFIAFPFALGPSRFVADINGIPIIPEDEQLPGTVRDWYPIQQWVSVYDSQRFVTVVPLEAPLMHLGGVTTGKWAETLHPESSTVMSWALNNHWMVNFKASQGGKISLRYRLTTRRGAFRPEESQRFAEDMVYAPIVLRDFIRRDQTAASGQFMKIEPTVGISVHASLTADGLGLLLRITNVSDNFQTCRVSFPNIAVARAWDVNMIEEIVAERPIRDTGVEIPMTPRSVKLVRCDIHDDQT